MDNCQHAMCNNNCRCLFLCEIDIFALRSNTILLLRKHRTFYMWLTRYKAAIYLCVRGIDYASFYALSSEFWTCSEKIYIVLFYRKDKNFD